MRVNQLAWTQKLKAFSETQKKNIIQDLQKMERRWKEDAGYEDVSLYIKMVKPEVGEPLFIISFHEDE